MFYHHSGLFILCIRQCGNQCSSFTFALYSLVCKAFLAFITDVCVYCLFDFAIVVRLPGMRAESAGTRQITVSQIPDTECNAQTLLGERR